MFSCRTEWKISDYSNPAAQTPLTKAVISPRSTWDLLVYCCLNSQQLTDGGNLEVFATFLCQIDSWGRQVWYSYSSLWAIVYRQSTSPQSACFCH